MLEFAEDLNDPRIAYDVIWVPIFPGYEDFSDAEANTPVSPGPEVRVWFDGDLVLPEGLADTYDVDLAWDIYLVFDPGREWSGDEPEDLGSADFWMHQLRDGPQDNKLNPNTFEAELRRRVPGCPAVIDR